MIGTKTKYLLFTKNENYENYVGGSIGFAKESWWKKSWIHAKERPSITIKFQDREFYTQTPLRLENLIFSGSTQSRNISWLDISKKYGTL